MLEFTVRAATLQSTFGFSRPQTAVLIRGGFPLLSRGGQAQQLAFCRDPRTALGELSPRDRGGRAPGAGQRGLGSPPGPRSPHCRAGRALGRGRTEGSEREASSRLEGWRGSCCPGCRAAVSTAAFASSALAAATSRVWAPPVRNVDLRGEAL